MKRLVGIFCVVMCSLTARADFGSAPGVPSGGGQCAQWALLANPDRISKDEAKRVAAKVIADGAEFKFEFDDGYPNDEHDFYFRFNSRRTQFPSDEIKSRYLAYVALLAKKYPARSKNIRFGCSFAIGGPR